MKKVTMILCGVLVASAVLTSCKKDYTCACKDSSGAEIITYTANLTKSDAETWCDDWNALMIDGSCSLD